MNPSHAAMVAAVIAVIVACVALRPKWLRLKAYMKDLRTPGFIPPSPTVRGWSWQLRLSRILTWVFVGKVKVVGEENLKLVPAGCSYQITPNHSHYADIFVVPPVIQIQNARYMADPAVMAGFGGLFGLIIAKMGAFAASRKAALDILVNGEPQVIFPEGWTYLDGNMGRFHNGAVHFSRQAAAKTERESYNVPMYIKYGRYPKKGIMKLPIRLQYALLVLGFIMFRRGATVVIGTPIPSSALPANNNDASELLRSEILKLKP